MPMRSRHDEWDDSGEEFNDLDEIDEADGEDDEPTVHCPYCRREIHEDAQRCPYCEHYISDEDAPPPRKPWWVIVGVLVCLYICIRWIFG